VTGRRKGKEQPQVKESGLWSRKTSMGRLEPLGRDASKKDASSLEALKKIPERRERINESTGLSDA